MNKLLLSAAAIGVLVATSAMAEDAKKDDHAGKVKCLGIAKAGKNDCKSAAHSCAGQAKTDNDKGEWAYASAEDCKAQGGTEAK